jgi:hypothetical protein
MKRLVLNLALIPVALAGIWGLIVVEEFILFNGH